MDIINIVENSPLEPCTEQNQVVLDFCESQCRKYGMYLGLLLAVAYGKILGKREERARRKAGAAK